MGCATTTMCAAVISARQHLVCVQHPYVVVRTMQWFSPAFIEVRQLREQRAKRDARSSSPLQSLCHSRPIQVAGKLQAHSHADPDRLLQKVINAQTEAQTTQARSTHNQTYHTTHTHTHTHTYTHTHTHTHPETYMNTKYNSTHARSATWSDLSYIMPKFFPKWG